MEGGNKEEGWTTAVTEQPAVCRNPSKSVKRESLPRSRNNNDGGGGYSSTIDTIIPRDIHFTFLFVPAHFIEKKKVNHSFSILKHNRTKDETKKSLTAAKVKGKLTVGS